MPKMMDAETERQLIGIRKATAHARRMYEQGIISHDELNRVQTYALEQRMLKFLDVEPTKPPAKTATGINSSIAHAGSDTCIST